MNPLGVFLLTLEWILYDHNAIPYNYGNAAQPVPRANEPPLTPASFIPPWKFSANDFILSESQLECALPIHFGYAHSDPDEMQMPSAVTLDHCTWNLRRPRVIPDMSKTMAASSFTPVAMKSDAVPPTPLAMEASRCERIIQLLQNNTYNYAIRMQAIIDQLRTICAVEMHLDGYTPDMIPRSFLLGVHGGFIYKLLRSACAPRMVELDAYDKGVRASWSSPTVARPPAPASSVTRTSETSTSPKRTVRFELVEFPRVKRKRTTTPGQSVLRTQKAKQSEDKSKSRPT
jgi:hypothetical protein